MFISVMNNSLVELKNTTLSPLSSRVMAASLPAVASSSVPRMVKITRALLSVSDKPVVAFLFVFLFTVK